MEYLQLTAYVIILLTGIIYGIVYVVSGLKIKYLGVAMACLATVQGISSKMDIAELEDRIEQLENANAE